MKRICTALLLLLSVASFAALTAQAPEPVDAIAIQKIREQGLNQSQVEEMLFQLTDVHGPRLTGSQSFEDAGDWAVERLKSWGFTNAHKERWAFGTGWSLNQFHATMTEPQTMPLIAMPKSWSAGTKGLVSAEVVRPQITNAEEAEQWKGKLRGKIVLTQDARQVNMLEGRLVLRMNEKEIEEALTPPPPPAPRGGGAGGRGGRAGGGGRGGGRGGANAFNLNDFYQAEGVVALFDRGGNSDTSAGGSDLSWVTQKTDGGTFTVGSGGSRVAGEAGTGLPQVTLAVEHYNRMVRLLDHNMPVKVDMNLDVSFRPETADRPNGFNIIADFPGTDLADEIVVVGAHFDSVHAATGATDNATGTSAMMEVLRIIKDAGLKPRRTIRVALWGGEEQGLLGSRAYVEEHLGTADAPKPGMAKHAAYYNLDNGTGKVRGIWMQTNPHVASIFGPWIAPLKDLGVEILGPRNVSSTDHSSFDRVGVPGFQFVQERLEYNSRTHHTNMDFLDRVQIDDVKQQATVAAVFAYQTAMRDALLPRKD